MRSVLTGGLGSVGVQLEELALLTWRRHGSGGWELEVLGQIVDGSPERVGATGCGFFVEVVVQPFLDRGLDDALCGYEESVCCGDGRWVEEGVADADLDGFDGVADVVGGRCGWCRVHGVHGMKLQPEVGRLRGVGIAVLL